MTNTAWDSETFMIRSQQEEGETYSRPRAQPVQRSLRGNTGPQGGWARSEEGRGGSVIGGKARSGLLWP